MPRKKKVTTVTEEIPDESVPGTQLPGDELPDDYEIAQNVLSQFGDTGVKIKVSKQGPKGPEYCFSTEELDEDYIQQYFGGGRYVLRIYVNDQFQRSVPLNIADRKMIPNGPAQAASADNQVLEMMREHNKTLLVILQSALSGGGNRSSVSELSEAIKALGFQNGAGTGSDKIVDAIFKGMELADRAGGKGDWKTELFSVIREVAPGAMEIMKNNNNQPRPSPALTSGSPPVPVPVTDEHAQIRQVLTYLKAQCMAGVDPGLIVEWTVSHAHDPQYQYFIGYALNTPLESIIQVDPEMGREPYKPWLESIIDGLRSSFTESDTVDTPVAAFPNSDKTNTPANGATGPKARAN